MGTRIKSIKQFIASLEKKRDKAKTDIKKFELQIQQQKNKLTALNDSEKK
nr:hypothetical protein [uncultured Carboxylicivirga sp.]